MASFYNHYYRYYRPFGSPISKPFSSVDAPSLPEETWKQEPHEKKIEKSSRSYSFGPIHFKNPFFTDIEEPLFEILGIQLYLDDIIILGLLFFLYQEGVKDEMLFIALILLLLG